MPYAIGRWCAMRLAGSPQMLEKLFQHIPPRTGAIQRFT